MEYPAPAIILLRPQLGENIGAVARAMSNFGLKELRLIAPRDGWPNPKALEMAANGKSIIESATLHATLAEGTADLHCLYATAGFGRDMEKRVLAPRQAAEAMRQEAAQDLKTGLLLGPERAGLANEEIARCGAVVEIPADPRNPSLNIAQAMVVFAYEWYGAEAKPAPPLTADAAPATREELEGFFAQLEEALDAVNYFRTPQKKSVMWQNLVNIFTRAPLSFQEVRTLRGMVRSLARHG